MKTDSVTTDVQEGVVKLLREQHDRNHMTISNIVLNWLTPIDYGPQQTDYIKRRQPGTGKWMLDSAEYQTWLRTKGQTLYTPGIPGAGKTIIAAIVIDDLYSRFQCDSSVGIAYLYCDFRRQQEQRTEDLLTSLLKQLSQKRFPLPDGVQDLYDQYKDQPKRPSRDEIAKALHSVSALYSKVFIIIDALDECEVTDGCRARLLSEVFRLQVKADTNLFATSRIIPEIQESFEESVTLEIRARDEDVEIYLANHMTRLHSFVSSDMHLQEMIKTTIAKAVDGMCV
jgi:hypothetical protein